MSDAILLDVPGFSGWVWHLDPDPTSGSERWYLRPRSMNFQEHFLHSRALVSELRSAPCWRVSWMRQDLSDSVRSHLHDLFHNRTFAMRSEAMYSGASAVLLDADILRAYFSETPLLNLTRLVTYFINTLDHSQEDIYSAFLPLVHLPEMPRYQVNQEAALSILDRIAGWCHPRVKLFPGTLLA